ncbi:hypothetical protein GCM10009540_38610 [Streptomyces turgidiscabies]
MCADTPRARYPHHTVMDGPSLRPWVPSAAVWPEPGFRRRSGDRLHRRRRRGRGRAGVRCQVPARGCGIRGARSAAVPQCRSHGLPGFTFLSTPFTRTVTSRRLLARSATIR